MKKSNYYDVGNIKLYLTYYNLRIAGISSHGIVYNKKSLGQSCM